MRYLSGECRSKRSTVSPTVNVNPTLFVVPSSMTIFVHLIIRSVIHKVTIVTIVTFNSDMMLNFMFCIVDTRFLI